jgi:epoxyqueuosine reductase
MNKIKKNILKLMEDKVDAIGFASIDRFSDAPEEHHPSRICKDAKTVIVFGKAIPRGIIHAPEYNLYALQRSYHTAFEYLNQLGLMLSTWIEDQGNYLSVQIPCTFPWIIQNKENSFDRFMNKEGVNVGWGLISLKHAAVNAGIGAFGKNELVHNPKYGTLLRFGAVVTSIELPADPIITDAPCKNNCSACIESCPVAALSEERTILKRECGRHSGSHVIYRNSYLHTIQSELGQKLFDYELMMNTGAYNYWLNCFECTRVCPNNY